MAYLKKHGRSYRELGAADPMPPEDPTSVHETTVIGPAPAPGIASQTIDPWAAPGPTGTIGPQTADFLKTITGKFTGLFQGAPGPGQPTQPTSSSPIGGIPTPILLGAAGLGLWLLFGRKGGS